MVSEVLGSSGRPVAKKIHLVAPLKSFMVTSYDQKNEHLNEYLINEYLILSVDGDKHKASMSYWV